VRLLESNPAISSEIFHRLNTFRLSAIVISHEISRLRSILYRSRGVSLSQRAFENIHEAASYAIKAHWKIKAWCVVIDCYSNSTLMLLTKLIIASQFAFFCSAMGRLFSRIRGRGEVKEKCYAIFQAQESLELDA
jgi:hypothetical protein